MIFGSRKQQGPTEAQVLEALKQVMDPDLGRDIVSLGFVKNMTISSGKVAFDVELTTPVNPVKEQLKSQCEAVVKALGVRSVKVNMTARVRQHAVGKRAVPGVGHLLAVASGKGGVGKSTLSINLALALKQAGARVGYLDCDIYGPSLPAMMGGGGKPALDRQKRMKPHDFFGMPVMSMGFLIAPGQAATWRGPMAHKMIQQFLFNVVWGELDYLILDLPPGTGDVQLSLTMESPLSAGLVVTTPQEAALIDARKGVEMFNRVGVSVLGFVENMSYYLCGKCDKKHQLFQEGGGERLAREYDLPLLSSMPLLPTISADYGEGRPYMVRESQGPVVEAFRGLAGKVASELSKVSAQAWAVPGPQAMEV